MNEILKHTADHLKAEGIPDQQTMRNDLENEREQKFIESVVEKIVRYQELFERFKGGDSLSHAEQEEMTALSSEFKRLQNLST